MAAGTPVSFAASAFESSKTPASLTPGQLTDEDCTGGVTPVASVGVGFSAVKSGSKWQKVRENLDLDGKPSPRGRRMLGRKPTATKKDWSVLKIAMNGMRLTNVQQSAESLALSQELSSLSPAREVMEEDLQAAETELQKTFRIAVRAAVELQGDLQHVQKRELAAKLESQLWEQTKWVENIINKTTSLEKREAEHKGATAALQEKVLAANQHISETLAATDESAREAEEESRRMLNEATAAADAAADEVEALRKRLNQVEGRVSSGEESLREKLAANAALEKELKDAAALHAFALADAREKHAAEAKELREKLSAAQMAFDTKLKAVESERENEAAELRANLVAAEGDAAERISEAASTERELQNLREKLKVSLAESVDASELREKLTAARDERERAVLDLEIEARKVDELRRELGDSIAAASLADDGLKAQLAAARAELFEKEGEITRNAEAHENEVAELQHKLVQAQSDGEAKVAVVAATKAEVEKRLAAAARDCDAIKLAGEARVLDLEKQLEDAAARSSEAIAASLSEAARLRADLEAANEKVNSMHEVEFSASKGEKRFADLESRLDVQRPRAESAEIFSVPEARLEASENELSHENAAVNEEVERLTAQLQRVRDVGEAEANENAKAQKAVVAATELSRGRDEELVTLRSCLQASENTVRQSTATLEEKLRETIELKTELALVSAALRSAERKVQELTESREGQTSWSTNADYGAASHSPEGVVSSLLDTPNAAGRDAAAQEALEEAKTSAAREHARLSKALREASVSLGTAHRELGEAREQALSACRRAEEAESAANASRAAAAIAEEGVTVAEASRRADAAAALLSMTKLEEEIERLRGIGGGTPQCLGNTSIVTAPSPEPHSHALQTVARSNRALTRFLTSGLGLALGSVAALSALAAAPYDENCSFLAKLTDAGSARPTCGFWGDRMPPT